VTARVIRMTSVGLVAMPADRDPATVCADVLASDRTLRTAFAELDALADEMIDLARRECDERTIGALEVLWNDALSAALDNNAEGVRAGLLRARDVAKAAGYQCADEDAALAMLPPVAGRRAA
jgi:hypothetical protein